MVYTDFGLKIHLHTRRLATEMDKCMQKTEIPEWLTKRHITKGVELPNQVVFRTFGVKKSYKYTGLLEADTIKEVETKK